MFSNITEKRMDIYRAIQVFLHEEGPKVKKRGQATDDGKFFRELMDCYLAFGKFVSYLDTYQEDFGNEVITMKK